MLPQRLHEFRNRVGPIACTRWGFPVPGVPGRAESVAAVLLLLVLAAGLAAGLAGCANVAGSTRRGFETWSYNAQGDSLGLRDFLALSSAEQNHRREQAAVWKTRAARTRDLQEQVHALNNAGGLAPDDVDTWLQLAGLWRWIGDYVQTVVWLDNAAAAVRVLGGGGDDPLFDPNSAHWLAARRTGLLRGWLHSDRAEWREGLDWINALERRAPGDASIVRLRGLLAAGAANRSLALHIAGSLERVDEFDTYVTWIRASLDRSRGLTSEALNFLITLRPDTDHASECWREMGEVAEMQQEYSHAGRYYRESFHSLPLDDTSSLRKLSYLRLGDDRFPRELDFWVAFDRYYVTGSLSAYTNYAWERYETGLDPVQRDFWAGQVVNAAGILLRKEMDRPWALRVRGLVFLETEELEKGLQDLRKCSRLLQESGREDDRVEAGLGRLLLTKERYAQALPHLNRAVALNPGNASAWADLGLTLAMTSDIAGAESALDRSLQLDPDSATAWYNRGLLNLKAGLFAQAESDLKEAVRLAPGNDEVLKLLQRAHSLQRNRTGKKTP